MKLEIQNIQITMAMEKMDGLEKSKCCERIFLKDSKGLVVKNRSSGGITEEKEPFAHECLEMDELVITFLFYLEA